MGRIARQLGLAALAAALVWGGAGRAQPNAGGQAGGAVTGVRGVGIVVDGSPAEPAWTEGPWYTGFTVAGSRNPAPVATRFAVRYDGPTLYLAAVMEEPRVADLRRTAVERDGRVWSDDCIEFMIDPTGDRVEYVHLAVNANGALYDAQVRQGGHVSSAEWDCTARAAASVGTGSWSVEVAVPIAELGLTSRSAAQPWAIQVGRERHAGGPLELSAYAPFGGSFHVPSAYAPLTLEGADLAQFLWDIKGPLEELVVRRDDGLAYEFKALVTNRTGRFRFTEVTASLRGEKGESSVQAAGGNDDGQQQTYAFRVPLREPGAWMLTLALHDRRQPDGMLAVRRIPVTLSYTPIRLRVLRPCYRDTIYATENLTEVVVRAELQLPETRLQGARLTARLYAGEDEAGDPVGTGQAGTDSRTAEVHVPCPDLAEGRHLLTVSAALADGETVSARVLLRKVPRAAHEWRIDENLVLRHNGEPFLPYGWFSGAAEDGPRLAAEGVTVVQDYNAQWFPPERTLKWLDELQKAGLYGTFYPWPSARFMDNYREPVSADEEAALRARVRAFRDHPALIAYYLWDEPELRPLLVARAERLYQIVADEDPYHPCIMLNDTIPGIHTYRNGGDILMPDPYPLFHRGGLAGRPIEYTARFMEACREASAGQRAWWVTPQAFDYFMGNKENTRPPNLTELRNQQLQALIHGARGILWYTYSHRYNYPDLDLGVPFLGREAQRLREALLAPEEPGAIVWEAEAPEHMHAAVRRLGADVVVLTVNTRTAPQRVRFTLEGCAARSLHVVSEGRSVSVSEGRFEDDFGLYEGHIYTTRPDLATGPTVAETLAAIDREQAARHKPGNLAYRDLGTTVSASSSSPYGGALWMVTDGAVRGDGWRDGTPRQYPDWLQVAFQEPATVGRVVVYSASVVDYEIQVEQEGQLRTVAEGRRAEGDGPLEVRFAPVRAAAVRVVVRSGSSDLTSINEVEVYAE